MPRLTWAHSIAFSFLLASTAQSAVCGFTENAGQYSDEVRVHASNGQIEIYVTEQGIVLDRAFGVSGSSRRVAITLRPGRDKPDGTVFGRGLTGTRRHFFLGNDPERWIVQAREYEEVVYRRISDGLDLIIALAPRGLRYRTERDGEEVAVSVRWTLDGVVAGRTLDIGAEPIETEAGRLWHSPSSAGSGGVISWGSPAGERGLRDPAGLVWSTFIGSSGGEKGLSVRLAPDGHLVITGRTSSPDFPTTQGSYEQEHAGENDVFVAKVTADGSGLLWSTLLGGNEYDVGQGLDVAANGDIVVVGTTSSTDFPTTQGAYAPASIGQRDGWAIRLSVDGSVLEWSTYLGGTDIDDAVSVRLDAAERVLMAGHTLSIDFPTSANAFDRIPNGDWDVFLSRLAPDGSSLEWSTFVGGNGLDTVNGMVVNDDGECVLVGTTASITFPVTDGALDTDHGGGLDVFTLAMASDGSALVWSTLLGETGDDSARGIALDGAGRPIVCGATTSPDFPTTPGSYATEFAGVKDGFVACLEPDATALRWSTLLGGSEPDGVQAVTTFPGGIVAVTGTTRSADFPTTQTAFDDTWSGGLDIFVATLSASGSILDRSTYLGGEARDEVYSIVAVPERRAVIVGHSDSATFPTTAGAYDEDHNGESDVVLCSLPADPVVVTGASLAEAGAFALRNHPNPFNPATVFAWDMPRPAMVSLTVYDVVGRRVRALLVGKRFAAGRHEIDWDGRDASGREVPAGTYVARLMVGERTVGTSISLVK